MPKVYLTKQEKLNNKLTVLVYGRMKVKRITQTQMGDLLGISQQGFSKKLKKAKFTYPELVLIFEKLEMSDEEILLVLRERKGVWTQTDMR